MESSCRRALEIGLPSIAFTDHADFNPFPSEEWHRLDIGGYHRAVEVCRALFPDLRILSGVELGEAHRFPAETAAVLAAGGLDRILGSVHCIPWGGALVDASVKGFFSPEDAAQKFRGYLTEVLALVDSEQPFSTLAHLDYPKRYWPHAEMPYRESEFEEEFRGILKAAARRGLILEVNTTRGAEHHRGLCPGPVVLRWWREEGGDAVAFGSDAHDPGRIAGGFREAAAVVEAAGFRPNSDPTGSWLR